MFLLTQFNHLFFVLIAPNGWAMVRLCTIAFVVLSWFFFLVLPYKPLPEALH
jgi:hypothetical protein